MRALGPGSVSSLLKTALDVAYLILWIVAVVVFLLLIAGLVLAPFIPQLNAETFTFSVDGRNVSDLSRYTPVVAAALVSLLVYLAGLIAIVGRLRAIFATLIAGDPFRPENVGRLRFIGAVLAALLLITFAAPRLLDLLPGAVGESDGGAMAFNPTAWFAVLVVFVLAEVFREGARLRHEAELTI
jgi:hypothetical protein